MKRSNNRTSFEAKKDGGHTERTLEVPGESEEEKKKIKQANSGKTIELQTLKRGERTRVSPVVLPHHHLPSSSSMAKRTIELPPSTRKTKAKAAPYVPTYCRFERESQADIRFSIATGLPRLGIPPG